MDLPELVRRCQQNDQLAWEQLVRDQQGRVYAIAMSYAGRREEALELAQEIFVLVYRRLHTCRDPQRFLAWLVRLARNAGVDFTRRRAARPPAHDLPVEELADLASPEPGPAEQLAADSRRRLVRRALRSLSGLSREIILLRDVQGLAIEDVAGTLGVPIGTVKSRSNRARIELAQAVRALDGGPGLEVPR